MTRVLRISAFGYSSCPRCGRFIPLEDEVSETDCPFCGASILSEPVDPPPGTLAHLASLPGRAGEICRALLAHQPVSSAARAPRRDPELEGDPGALPRNFGIDEIDVDRTPRHAVWELTLACDLKCVHCGSRAGTRRSAELSTTQCLNLVREMADLGIREVTLIGGEAYMRRDWPEIAAEVVRQGMACSMTTGGRSFDDRRLAQAIDAGIGAIGVSIDGLEATHDALRGVPGSWRNAVAASERIAASPIRLATNTQLNVLSAPELPGIARLMDEIGSAAWQLHLTVAMGRAADRPDLLLQPDDLLEIFPLLVWVREQILDPAGIAFVMANNIGYFSPFEPALRYGGDAGVHWSGCSAGIQVIGIEADGTIKGCPSLATDDFAGGRAGERPLDHIVFEAPELTTMAGRTGRDLRGFCRSCLYADVCRAGCSWTTHSLFGVMGDNPYCIHRAMTREAEGMRERLVKTEPAPGRPFDTGRFVLVEESAPPQRDRPATVLGVEVADVVATTSRTGGHVSAGAVRDVLTPREAGPQAPRPAEGRS